MFAESLTGRYAPQSDLLNLPIDLDLHQVPLRKALQALCAPTHQGFTIDANVPAGQRVTVHGKKMQLFRALDDVIRQVGGGWMQEMRNGRPTIRIGRDLFLTMHEAFKLPQDKAALEQIGRYTHLTTPTAGSATR